MDIVAKKMAAGEPIDMSDTGRPLTEEEVAHNHEVYDRRRRENIRKRVEWEKEFFATGSVHARLYRIYAKLRDEATDDRGYGGQVVSEAVVEGWKLRIATSSWGELMASAVKGERDDPGRRWLAWECGPDNKWYHQLRGMKEGDEELEEVIELFEKAEWEDQIVRRRGRD
jgi:hypothetical protein